MADLLDQQHVDAGLNLLRADASLTVYPDTNGNVPATLTPPYVRVYSYTEVPPDNPDNALNGTSGRWTTRWYCHAVGATENSARAVAMRVRAALLDQRPSIALRPGLQVGLIRQESATPPNRDESTGTSVYDLVVVYVLETAA